MAHEGKDNRDMKHIIMMTLACTIPFAIILILPFFDISSKWATFGAVGLMIFLHVLMMKDHFSSNNIEIPSNSVTLQSGISNRHSRTKGDTINGNVYIKGGIK